ncbi:hypothetical protein COU78_00950 [Candidatus Peregrinibacteria bacterium CG10_big_fil_rev_8_21_14_0_10_49_24]|nr:MAG: hypothetical protein COV83_01200 [Candidatus Peregrinibacteria bacterium CG11_big_fil_rev_8_21_14_0_20_49_14]PIR51517.1 MAG: hypothetical protein COU78_00950 [Candidatus Peregrinibacteria bacterium CG10_big_fil_rev_8_21_14_0_10_49_24]PJA67840.1 MAG: hypothetical protein CO157_02390 [Candidatus Peregrinibacteria bacterium CG_4_9_14_3_um_filter_49_12]
MSRILVTGSVAYDLLLTYDGSFTDALNPEALDSLSVGYVTPHFAKHHGGTGANIAWGLSLLGQNPLLVATVGSDGGAYLSLLEERGVRTNNIQQLNDAFTSTAIIGTDDLEHQIIFYHPGADAKGVWPDLADDRDDIEYAIVSPRDATVMMNALAWCDEFGVKALFDPGQQVMSFSADTLMRAIGHSQGIIANMFEWSVITETLNTTEGDLLQYVPFIVVTRGEKGAQIFTKEDAMDVPACTAERVVNPTGAGDALRAGLLTGLSNGWSLQDSVRLGAAMGSFAVESEGTLLDSLDMDHLHERVRAAYGEELPALS